MYRRALARHRTGAALLLGLALRAASASAEPDETRVGSVEGQAAEELPSAAETPPIVFLDRVRVVSLYRVGLGPSVIHLGLIDRVDPYPGGYSARLGEANLRLLDVGGLIETPFARALGSLLPALLSLLSPEVKLAYRDHQTRATYEPSARDRFSELGFGSYAPLGEKRNGFLMRLGDACRPRITFTW